MQFKEIDPNCQKAKWWFVKMHVHSRNACTFILVVDDVPRGEVVVTEDDR